MESKCTVAQAPQAPLACQASGTEQSSASTATDQRLIQLEHSGTEQRVIAVPESAPISTESSDPARTLKVLYIFAGAERKCDLRHYLSVMQEFWHFELSMKEVDLMRSELQDVENDDFWQSLMRELDEGLWHLLIITPPCHTHSRALNSWRTSPGPKPVRSSDYPWGFPWLEGAGLQRCLSANAMIVKTFEAVTRAHAAGIRHLVEHPEDLGRTSSGEIPAALWQYQEVRDIQVLTDASTWAIFQCVHLAPSPKPTRFLSDLKAARLEPYQGWPVFDNKARYLGPLPKQCPHGGHGFKLHGRDSSGEFRTGPSAAYPPDMCFWLAQLILHSFFDEKLKLGKVINGGRGSSSKQIITSEVDSDTDDDLAKAEASTAGRQNRGPPVSCFWDGKRHPFVDGFGLCSPGRWDPRNRGTEMLSDERDFCEALSKVVDKHLAMMFPDPQRSAIALALGKVSSKPFSDQQLDALREDWFALLPDPVRAREIPEFQPFFLHAMAQTARLSGDADWEILDEEVDSFATGVPVGIGIEMPRTPAVFSRKKKWRKYDESEAIFDMENYKSALEAGSTLQKQFEEEEKLGMMFPTSLALAKAEYPGDRLRIAAQGAIKKSDGSFRPLHDGTHGVQVNNDIKPRDQIEFPGPAEEATAMEHSRRDEPGVEFALAADVSKAHRRCKHRKADWGYLACRADQDSTTVWINRVGTFGIGSIAYWWARLVAVAGRITFRLCMSLYFWMLVFADDIKVVASGKDKWKCLLKVYLIWIMMGTPFAWHKFRGGLELDWVGYWLDYVRFEMGLSESRTQWLCTFVASCTTGEVVLMRRFEEGLGRLGFAARILVWMKPFLAPLYAWASVVTSGTALKPPLLVSVTCKFILEALADNSRIGCASPELASGEVFRTDAKCDDDFVVLGGWETAGEGNTSTARWFSLKLTKLEVPWLFKDGKGSSWASTSAELLASLVAAQIFLPKKEDRGRISGEVVFSGGN